MDVLNQENLPLVVLLILPGLISRKVFDVLVPSRGDSTGRDVLDALTYGAINFSIWFVPLVIWLLPWSAGYPFRLFEAMVVVLLVSPVALAFLAKSILSSRTRFFRHPTPTSWDYFFDLRRPAWIRVHLRSGGLAGGFYGMESFASETPHRRDLYVQQTWRLDSNGAFVERDPRSQGFLVSADDCELIELYETEGTGTKHDERS